MTKNAGSFDYKKWVTENKYGKPNINYINEQLIGDDWYSNPNVLIFGASSSVAGYEEVGAVNPNATETYMGCSQCEEGFYACTPTITFTVNASEVNWGAITNNPSSWNANMHVLSNNELNAGFQNYGGPMAVLASAQTPYAANFEQNMCTSGSALGQGGEATSSNYQPFCCDINAMNFGQMANGQPYGMSPGEPEQYLMQNGPSGSMCDNSICQGNVNEPAEPEGQAIPQPIATLDKDKLKPGIKKPSIKPDMDPRRQKPGIKPGMDPRRQKPVDKRKLRETWNKLEKLYKKLLK